MDDNSEYQMHITLNLFLVMYGFYHFKYTCPQPLHDSYYIQYYYTQLGNTSQIPSLYPSHSSSDVGLPVSSEQHTFHSINDSTYTPCVWLTVINILHKNNPH